MVATGDCHGTLGSTTAFTVDIVSGAVGDALTLTADIRQLGSLGCVEE